MTDSQRWAQFCSYRRPFTGDVVKTGLSLLVVHPSLLLLLFLRGFASPSIVMTSLMEGLSFGSLAVQRSASLRTNSISSWTCLQLPTLGSSASSNDLLSLTFLHIRSTMSTDSLNSGYVNRLSKLRSSSRTTPKLYMSIFSSTFNMYPYSANIIKITILLVTIKVPSFFVLHHRMKYWWTTDDIILSV